MQVFLRHPDIPWSDITNAGAISRHAYHGINGGMIWKTVADRLRSLKWAIKKELVFD
jgi:uncharacterized protein with HEPN domain